MMFAFSSISLEVQKNISFHSIRRCPFFLVSSSASLAIRLYCINVDFEVGIDFIILY